MVSNAGVGEKIIIACVSFSTCIYHKGYGTLKYASNLGEHFFDNTGWCSQYLSAQGNNKRKLFVG